VQISLPLQVQHTLVPVQQLSPQTSPSHVNGSQPLEPHTSPDGQLPSQSTS
jgi:hypothetical protein